MQKNDFTVTFWIRISENPDWANSTSLIRFPPVLKDERVSVFTTKYKEFLKIFVLDQDLGYRKIKTKINDFIGKDTFVALTVEGDLTKLYLNAKHIITESKNEMKNDLEIGDVVMVEVRDQELLGVRINEEHAIFQAEVKQIFGENGTFYFTDLNQMVVLPLNRIQFN